jgi:hypothetical protein
VSVEPIAAAQRPSLFTTLNRSNRIAALVLRGIAAVFVAALIFGTGVLVGSEFGESEGDRHGSEAPEHGDDAEQGGVDQYEGPP